MPMPKCHHGDANRHPRGHCRICKAARDRERRATMKALAEYRAKKQEATA